MKQALNFLFVLIFVQLLTGCGVTHNDGITHYENTDQFKNKPISNDGDDIFVIVDEMPEFPGGFTALRTYVANNVIYPVQAALNKIQGKVFVQFIVDKDGSVTNAKVVRGVNPDLDLEALRVVQSIPNFKPGKIKGEPVRVSYTIPINFHLN